MARAVSKIARLVKVISNALSGVTFLQVVPLANPDNRIRRILLLRRAARRVVLALNGVRR